MRLPAKTYIRSGLSAGLSARAAYRLYQQNAREIGATAIRLQDFQRVWSQTLRLRGQASEAVRAPKDIPGGGLQPVRRDTYGRTGYIHWVLVHQRTSGTSDLIETPWAWKSREIMTPEDVEQAVLGQLAQSEREYKRITISALFTGLEGLQPTLRN